MAAGKKPATKMPGMPSKAGMTEDGKPMTGKIKSPAKGKKPAFPGAAMPFTKKA